MKYHDEKNTLKLKETWPIVPDEISAQICIKHVYIEIKTSWKLAPIGLN